MNEKYPWLDIYIKEDIKEPTLYSDDRPADPGYEEYQVILEIDNIPRYKSSKYAHNREEAKRSLAVLEKQTQAKLEDIPSMDISLARPIPDDPNEVFLSEAIKLILKERLERGI
jgi:hypothetical protein